MVRRFDIQTDGPFRYVHCRETGALLSTLVMERNGNLRYTGKFVEEEGEAEPAGRTLREWKAIFARRWPSIEPV